MPLAQKAPSSVPSGFTDHYLSAINQAPNIIKHSIKSVTIRAMLSSLGTECFFRFILSFENTTIGIDTRRKTIINSTESANRLPTISFRLPGITFAGFGRLAKKIRCAITQRANAPKNNGQKLPFLMVLFHGLSRHFQEHHMPPK
jgi:hypothetical protein